MTIWVCFPEQERRAGGCLPEAHGQIFKNERCGSKVRDFNYLDICWEMYSTKAEQWNKFLICLDDNFVFQKVEGRPRGLLGSLPHQWGGMVDEMKAEGTLPESDEAISILDSQRS